MLGREHLDGLRRFACFAAAGAGLFAVASCSTQPAYAHRYHPHHPRHAIHARHHRHLAPGADARPAQWCGWFMRHLLGVADRTLNRAIAWAHWGEPAHGPAPGVVVVWPHHVGLIKRRAPDGRYVVLSGNDGHAVRERERSLAGAVAFRRRPSL